MGIPSLLVHRPKDSVGVLVIQGLKRDTDIRAQALRHHTGPRRPTPLGFYE
jgi:hypothetical protein